MLFLNQRSLWFLLSAFLLLVPCCTPVPTLLFPTPDGLGYNWTRGMSTVSFPQLYAFPHAEGYMLAKVDEKNKFQPLKKVMVVDHTVFFSGGTRSGCIAYQEKLNGPWQVVTNRGRPLVSLSDSLFFVPTRLDSLPGGRLRVSVDTATVVLPRIRM